MKRSITAILAGGAVFGATVAFAATLTVDGNNLGAGTDTLGIAACDDNGVDTTYTTAWDSTDNRFEVTGVTVNGIAEACEGEDVQVELLGASGASLGGGTTTETVGDGETLVDFAVDANVNAGLVENVAVTIYDAE